MWKSVWGECGKVCWCMRKVKGEVWGSVEKVKGDVETVKKCGGMCGRVYRVSVECVGAWGR